MSQPLLPERLRHAAEDSFVAAAMLEQQWEQLFELARRVAELEEEIRRMKREGRAEER